MAEKTRLIEEKRGLMSNLAEQLVTASKRPDSSFTENDRSLIKEGIVRLDTSDTVDELIQVEAKSEGWVKSNAFTRLLKKLPEIIKSGDTQKLKYVAVHQFPLEHRQKAVDELEKKEATDELQEIETATIAEEHGGDQEIHASVSDAIGRVKDNIEGRRLIATISDLISRDKEIDKELNAELDPERAAETH